VVKSKEEMKVLGIIVDRNLNWELHLKKLISKIKSFNFVLRYLRDHLSLGDMKKILNAHIVSRITCHVP